MTNAARALLIAMLGCTFKPDIEPESDTPSETGSPTTAVDSGIEDPPVEDSDEPSPPVPLEADCSVTEGRAVVSGQIEGSPARLTSAAWYSDGSGTAWVVLSPDALACSHVEAFKSNAHDLRALSLRLNSFGLGHSGPVAVRPEAELDAEGGAPEAVVLAWEPLLNLEIILEHGLMMVHSVVSGDTLQVTGLDTWSEYADAVEGDFTACWCPALEDFTWPRVVDTSPPAPPPFSP